MPLTEANYTGDWLKDEFGEPNYCREEVTIASGQNLVSGAVVAKITASSKYSEYNNAASSTGEEVAAGILVFAVNATSGDKPGVIIKRGPAVVSKEGLTWKSGADSTDKNAGLADLLTLGIVARDGA